MEIQTPTHSPINIPLLSLSEVAMVACAAASSWAFASGDVRHTLFIALGAAAAVALIFHPEVGLALYVVIGDVKGDDRLAALFPVDLTLALLAILLAGIALHILRGKQRVMMPPIYFLFLPVLAMMAGSLAYTPVFDAGLEKLARFLTVTGIVIVAPFFVLGSAQAMRRFLGAFAVLAFVISAWSISSLGGSERLATPSNNTIGLGHIACSLILLIWFAVIPHYSFPQRALACLLLAVPGLALLGSGSRGPAIACIVVLLMSHFFHRPLLPDIAGVAILSLAALPFIRIPDASIEYLATLVRSRSVDALLSFRGDLLDYGWNLLQRHPLIGTGIQGYRYYSPNPAVYNWPHNIFLEIACELGIPAALLVCAIFAGAIHEAFLQMRDTASPHFSLAQIAAALLVIGIVNATNTGDINSDRSTWLFVSLAFVAAGLRKRAWHSGEIGVMPEIATS